jgi:hypothetical protein
VTRAYAHRWDGREARLRPAAVIGAAGRLRGASLHAGTGAMSLLQARAQPHRPADGQPQPPFGACGPPRSPGHRGKLPGQVVPLGLRQDLALPFAGELAANMWMYVHVTHLPSAAFLT